MSELHTVQRKIREHLEESKNILVIGRNVGQKLFNLPGKVERVEIKPDDFPPEKKARRWSKELLKDTRTGDFDSIIFHRLIYNPMEGKEHLEDPEELMKDAWNILPKGGKLLVNSYLQDKTTDTYFNKDCFFNENEMKELLEKHGFTIKEKSGHLFVCEK